MCKHFVQDCLDGFTESVQSNYECLFVGGNVVMVISSCACVCLCCMPASMCVCAHMSV